VTGRQPQPSSSPGAPARVPRRWLLLIFLLAFSLRAGWGTWRLAGSDDTTRLEFPDEQQYWLMAQSLYSGDGLVDELGFRATRMPLYPALLALSAGSAHGVIWAKAWHWVVGALAAALAMYLAGAMFDRRVALGAGLWVACDPFLVFFSSLLLTETLSIALLLALWIAAWPIWRAADARGSWPRWLAVAALAVACVYARESSAGLIGLLLVLLIGRHRGRRRVVAGAAGVAGLVVLALLPWAWRNQHVTGDFCFLTHRGGISLYDGVGPQARGDSDLGDIKQMPAVQGLNEVEWNRYFLREAKRAMAADPGRIARLAVVKWARLWNPIPNVETYQSAVIRLLAAAWTLPTFALAAAAVILLGCRRDGRGGGVVLWLLLPALYATALHALFVGSVRYRLGAMPMLEVLAAWALVELWGRCCRRLRTHDV